MSAGHVNRQFKAPRPNALWVSDFTYVATWAGFVYVCARRIVGWRVSRTAHASFMLDALEQALHDRHPLRRGRQPPQLATNIRGRRELCRVRYVSGCG